MFEVALGIAPEPCCFLSPGYLLLFCLRFAYAVAMSAYAGLLRLDLPTRAYAYHLVFDVAYGPAFGAFVGSALSCLSMFCLRGSWPGWSLAYSSIAEMTGGKC